ncbi:MAG: bifunctional riboflavin kinase/FAD synthetase [Cyclobacteriaceae bacterium]|nr:bifunctional riboflavin kinase/FAD synthetase [Cyclobacteriaceae bacterium]
MRIYYSIDDFSPVKNAVVTSGTFDGVHVGHKKILSRLTEIARKTGGETVVITFWPHPRLVLYPDDSQLRLLNTFEEKAELLKKQGVHHLLRIPFTKEFSQLSSEAFITNILVEKIGTWKLVIGYDHHFGKNREGSFEQLKLNGPKYGFEVEEIPRQDIDNIAVSSTKIRQSIEAADMATASHLLGQPYTLSGRVIKGDQIGRQLGYPTANLEVDSLHKLIPADGIYAVHVHHSSERYRGALYIGNRPTVDGTKKVIEVNIFNFSREIYGESLTIEFHAFIRHDKKLNSLDELKNQIATDKENVLLSFQL